MSQWSTIPISKLENFGDCSAEYYRPEFLQRSAILRKWPTVRLSRRAYITDGEHGSPDFDPNSGIRYITADYIRPNFIEDEPMPSISARQDLRNARCHVQDTSSPNWT